MAHGVDSSATMRADWPTVGVSHAPADSVTCQSEPQLTLAALDHQLDLITRSESLSASAFSAYVWPQVRFTFVSLSYLFINK